jgi:hypothetical protein
MKERSLKESHSPTSPHLAPDIIEDLYQPLRAAWLADYAAVQADGHHLGRSCTTLLEEGVESVLRRREKVRVRV